MPDLRLRLTSYGGSHFYPALQNFGFFFALKFLCGYSVDLPLYFINVTRECIHLLILLYVADIWALKKGG